MKLFTPFRPRVSRNNRRATLRDLYVAGLVNVFRRHSILRIWQPLRETARHNSDEAAG